MFYLKVYFLIAIGFMTFNFITCLDADEIRENIGKYVTVNESNDDYMKQVNIAEINDVSIHQYHYKTDKMTPLKYNLNAFYIAVSCKFADWTLHALYMLIQYCPLTSRPFFDTDKWYNSYIKPVRQEFLNGKVGHIKLYLAHFLTLLTHIINIFPQSLYSYYTDTSILKMFLSIKIKVHFISSKSFENPNIKIVQLIIKEMTEIQGFLSTNCSIIPASKKDSQFIGYYLNIDNDYVENHISSMNKLLAVIGSLGINKLDSPLLTSGHMYLENFVKIDLTDNTRKGILNATLIDYENKTIGDVLMNDIDDIYLIQDSILNAVFKLIVNEIVRIIKNHLILPEISEKIKSLNQIIKNINDNPSINKIIILPPYFVQGFRLLPSIIVQLTTKYNPQNTDNHETLISEIDKSFNEECGVNLEEEVNNKNDMIKEMTEELTDEVTNEVTKEDDYLCNILDRLIEELNGINYHVNTLTIILLDNEKYNAPFMKSNNIQFLPTSQSNDTTCDFVLSIYELCRQGLFYYNECCGHNEEPNNFYLKRAIKIYSNVKLYMIMLIINKNNNFDLLKMAFNVAILLVNIPNDYDKGIRIFKIYRMTNVIENELRKYCHRNCHPLNYNLLLLNNINLLNFGDNNSINNRIKNFLNISNIDEFSIGGIKHNDYKFLDFQYLYRTFVEPDDIFSFYQNDVVIIWKERNTCIKDIFMEILMYNIKPLNYYLFFDLYFKFYIAVVYYEIEKAREGSQINQALKKFQTILELKSNIIFDCDSFPQKYHPFIHAINSKFISQANQDNTILQESSSCIDVNKSSEYMSDEDINNKFKEFGISFNFSNFFNFINFEENIKKIKITFNNVKQVNSLFLKFKSYSN